MELLFFFIHERIVHLILARPPPLLLDLITGRTCHPVFSSLVHIVRSDLISD